MASPWEVRGKTIWEKIGGLHWFWVGLVIVFLIFIPTIKPMGLPITTTEWTEDAYNALINVPKDKYVIWEDLWSITGLASAESGHIALARIMMENDIKFVMVGLDALAPALHLYVLDAALKTPEAKGKVYGEDYAVMGFLAGMEGALPSMAEDFHKTFPVDYYGKPIDSLPMMAGLRDYKDVALVISSSSSQTWVDAPIRQWYSKYNVPIISYPCTGGAVLSSTYWPDRGVLGIVEGSRGGAEMEFLGHVPGPGVAQSDAKTLAFAAVAVFIVIGNISHFMRESKE